METKDEVIALSGFAVGQEYSRLEIAEVGKVTPPASIFSSNWSQGIVEFQNAVLLFVTLEKEVYSYQDYFEDRLFWWQSQNRQTQQSDVIARLADASLPAYLFVRLRPKANGKTLPFVYCGALGAPAMQGDKPVTCLFDALDYVDDATGRLAEVYDWRSNIPPTTEDQVRHAAVLEGRAVSKQGRQIDKELRLALEHYSMQKAVVHYAQLGYDVADTSRNRPYDLVCTRNSESRRVEVKGTVTAGTAVIVTVGEVRAARETGISTDLFVVKNIVVVRDGDKRELSGGDIAIISPWLAEDEYLSATEYVYSLPRNEEK